MKGPLILNDFHSSGKVLKTNYYKVIDSDDGTVVFPPEGRSISIFWATWCAPCKLEMERLSSSVRSGKINKEKIFAINPYESNEDIRRFTLKHQYPFTFIDAGDVAKFLNVKATPTTIFIENNSVSSMSTGMSLIGIWRAEIFLSPKVKI